MPLQIVRNDLTHMHVDVIVNPTNAIMYGTAGVDGAIHKIEGDWLRTMTSGMGELLPGQVKITPAKHLPCKSIIHTHGPIWIDGNHQEEEILRKCYWNAMELAIENDYESIAFPLIASGTFGYPKDQALFTATETIGRFLMDHDLLVYLVVYDKRAYQLSQDLYDAIDDYIDDHYVDDNDLVRAYRLGRAPILEESAMVKSVSSADVKTRSLDDLLDNLGESFSQMLIRLIDERDLKDADVYKRANVTKQTFWKILNKADYTPKKATVLALAISLQLTLDETEDLLRKAGYALANNNKMDTIVTYCIEQSIYNINTINVILFDYEAGCLGL